MEERFQNQNNDTLSTINSNQTNAMSAATTATQVSPFHGVVDSSSSEGKKLHKKATQGLPADQKIDADPKGIIKFVEGIQSERDETLHEARLNRQILRCN